RDGRRLLDADTFRAKIVPCSLGIADAQSKVPRTDRVRFWLLQQMQGLPAAQVEPEDHEIKCVRWGDLLEPENVAIEMPAPRHVGNDHGAVVHVRDSKRHSAGLSRCGALG